MEVVSWSSLPQLFYFSYSLLFSPSALLCSFLGKLHNDVTTADRVTVHRCLSYFSTLLLSLSPSTPSPHNTPFHPTTLTFFVVYDPPPSPSSSLPSIFFPSQAQRRWEEVLSVHKSIGLTHLWVGLQRQHHHCIWLYSMRKGEKRRGGGGRGTQGC